MYIIELKNNEAVVYGGVALEIKKIKLIKPGPRIRDLSADGRISKAEWKRILKKYSS